MKKKPTRTKLSQEDQAMLASMPGYLLRQKVAMSIASMQGLAQVREREAKVKPT